MKKISETAFKKRVQQDLKFFGEDIDILKTQERGRKGVPDLIICLRGRYIAIELKKVGEEATPLQKLKLAQRERAGAITFVADENTWPAQFAVLKALK